MLGFFVAEAPVEGLTCEEVEGLLTEEDGFDTDEDRDTVEADDDLDTEEADDERDTDEADDERDTDDPCLFAEEDDCDVDVPLLTCAWASN